MTGVLSGFGAVALGAVTSDANGTPRIDSDTREVSEREPS
jgi:hypothetical protein